MQKRNSNNNNNKKPPSNKRPNRPPKKGGNKSGPKRPKSSKTSRGQAMRAHRRSADDAHKLSTKYLDASQVKNTSRANAIDDTPRLRVIGLGGMDSGGSKNMIVVEYQNEAIIIDAGIDLGIDLPGINFGIPDVAYLESIKKKVKAVVITHGHLDHIGALPYVLPKFPGVPVYGSRFTIGRVEEIMGNSDYKVDNYELKTIVMNQDNHERLRIGAHFTVELVRVTHSIPGSTLVVVDTPVGRIINTGDFKIDPDPLDHHPTDIPRLKELGKEGVLALLSECTTPGRLGRTPTEQVIEPTFHEIFKNAPGRVFASLFSTNTARVQMIVNAAVSEGRKIAIDGRSMMSTLEMAVKLGFIKIPKGTFIPIAASGKIKDENLVVICTGSQGEENAALVRMATGDHKHIKMKAQDTVVLSSSPIPMTGNDAHVGRLVDNLLRKSVHVFQHITRDLDNHGPLHVSGHASQEEYGEMIDFMQPKFFMPIYGDYQSKKRHIEIAVERGIARKDTVNAELGDVMEFTKDSMVANGQVPYGTVLIDNTGAMVSNVVIKDRLLMAQEGLVSIILTIDKKTGQLLSSPDIITRGFIYMRDNEELMNNFRAELKRVVNQRFKRVDLDRFKTELKDHVTFYLFEQTQRSPIVIPVVNVVGGKVESKKNIMNKRAEMLGQDQRD